MKRTSHNQPQWLVILTATSALLLLALLALTTTHAKYSSSAVPDFTYDHRRFPNPDQYFVDSDDDDENYGLGLPRLPRFAYLITGSKGDGPQLKRLLQAAYHPRNDYLLHLDLEASDSERLELAKYVKLECDERVSECDGGWNCRFGDRISISGEAQSWKSRPDSKIGNQKSGILGMSLILISSLIESVEIAAAKL